MKPRILDLFCCQGGASAGYEAAGFLPHGVDLDSQSRYPYDFTQSDALQFLRERRSWIRHNFVAVHASPPCQRKTKAQKIQGREHPALIAPTRELLIDLGLPYVIENVVAEGIDDDPLINPVVLCGAMFGMQTYRHREFEAGNGFTLTVPDHPAHTVPLTKMGRPRKPGTMAHYVGNFSGVADAKADMGVPWMDRDGIREAIPPVYAVHVGRQLMAHLTEPVQLDLFEAVPA